MVEDCVMAGVKLANIDKVTAFIESVPRGVKATAMREIGNYVIGDSDAPPGKGRHGLRHDPPYKHIRRAQAYPNAVITIGKKKKRKIKGYFSVKQFFWVMRNVKRLGRKNSPTKYSQTWQMQNDSHWDRIRITGNLPFDRFPANLNRMGGWRPYPDVVESNLEGAIKSAIRKVDEWLAEKAK